MAYRILQIAIAVYLIGCNSDISDMNSATSKSLSENIILHRTSGRDVAVTDKDGFGLVQGNVTELCVIKDAGVVAVKALPFDKDAKEYIFVTLDLKTGKQVKYDISGIKFRPVSDYL